MSQEVEIANLPTRGEILQRIEHLDASADMKLLLVKIADVTIEVGGKLFHVGRRILDFSFEMIRSYPNIVLGVAVALVISVLVSSIPLFGPFLAAFVTPLLLAFGIGMGALNDMKDGALRQKVYKLEAQFRAMGVA